LPPDISDLKALATALKLHTKFETIERLARDWIERGMREKKAEDFEEARERREWYDLRDSWERATRDLTRKVSDFKKETGCSPILGYVREADQYGVKLRVFTGYDSSRSFSHSGQAKGYSIVDLSFPQWFEELNLPTEEMSEEDVYRLVPVERMGDEEERTLRQSFVEDLREGGIERFGEYMPRYESAIDRRRTYNENVFRVDDLVKRIIRERALVPRLPTPIAVAVPPVVKPAPPKPEAALAKPKFLEKSDVLSLMTVGVMWSWDSLRDALRKRGFDVYSVDGERRLRDVLDELLREGILYEPRREYYARSEAKVTALAPAPELKREVPSEVKVKVHVEEGMNLGEYFVHLLYDSFEVTFSGALSTQALKDYLEEKEDYVDFREQLSLQGFSEPKIEEELKKLPWPFSSGEEIKVVWTPQDIEFTPTTKMWWDAFNKAYSRPELEAFDWERLKTIAKLKGVRIGANKPETVASILGGPAPPTVPTPPPAGRPPAPTPAPTPPELPSGEIERLKTVVRVKADELGLEWSSKVWEDFWRRYQDRAKELWATKRISYTQEEIEDVLKAVAPPETLFKPPVARARRAKFVSGIRAILPEPKSLLTFPRAPSSEEQAIFWEHFKNALGRMEKSYLDYRNVFAERMALPYRSWEAVLKSYEGMLSDIKAGRTVTWISLAHTIAMPWREDSEENWRSDAICHLTSTRLYKTIDELIYSFSPEGPPGLESYGVPNVTPEEVKRVIKKAWKEKSLWFLTTPKEWLEAFIGEPLEQ